MTIKKNILKIMICMSTYIIIIIIIIIIMTQKYVILSY